MNQKSIQSAIKIMQEAKATPVNQKSIQSAIKIMQEAKATLGMENIKRSVIGGVYARSVIGGLDVLQYTQNKKGCR